MPFRIDPSGAPCADERHLKLHGLWRTYLKDLDYTTVPRLAAEPVRPRRSSGSTMSGTRTRARGRALYYAPTEHDPLQAEDPWRSHATETTSPIMTSTPWRPSLREQPPVLPVAEPHHEDEQHDEIDIEGIDDFYATFDIPEDEETFFFEEDRPGHPTNSQYPSRSMGEGGGGGGGGDDGGSGSSSSYAWSSQRSSRLAGPAPRARR